MYRERIAEDVYVFTSNLYAQVTAGAVVTPEGVVVIDTLPFPSETRQMMEFLERRSSAGMRYLILTHYHADHTLGASLFEGVPVISHALCRDLLAARGAAALAQAREQNPELSEVSLRLPDIVFDDGQLSVRLGGKTIVLTHLSGHSDDCLTAYLKDDKILFASDVMTPVPMIVDGDPLRLIDSLRRIRTFNLENVVQGHGEMILRGEISEAVSSNVNYLNRVLALVAGLVREGRPRDVVEEYGIESCGKSRIPLHGLVQEFHTANLYTLYDRLSSDGRLYKMGLQLLAEREAVRADAGKSKARSKATARKTVGAKMRKKTSKTESRAKVKTKAGTKTRTRTRAKTVKKKSAVGASKTKRSSPERARKSTRRASRWKVKR